MGWWGYGVVEGDEPMDLLPDVRDAIIGDEPNEDIELETDEEYDEYQDARHALMVEKMKTGDYTSAITRIQEGEFDEVGDQNIALQVLGELIMVNGGVMDAETKAIVIEAAENDEWANEDSEDGPRYKAMQAFIERVKSYEGVVLEPNCLGLFAAISQHIGSGEEGLLNK